MKKVFIINGGQKFAHSGGKFQETLTNWTQDFLQSLDGVETRITNINDPFNADKEVENFVWADLVIYHIPIWWFQVPNAMKKYIDEVFTAGHQNGIYKNDGRSRQVDPNLNYGTGGLLHGRKYMLTTSWNAPKAAFTLPGEFFKQTSVDDGVMFGFHRMNAFTGMEPVGSFHFYDMEKGVNEERIPELQKEYTQHLEKELVPLTLAL